MGRIISTFLFLIYKLNSQYLTNNKFLGLVNFIKKHNHDAIYIFYSGVSFDPIEGQTSVMLAKEFAKKDIPILYVYFHYQGNKHQYSFGEIEDNIFVCSSYIFILYYRIILTELLKKNPLSTLIITHPNKDASICISYATQIGLRSLYHIIDLWSDFKKQNLADWYEKKYELTIIKKACKISCVNSELKQYYSNLRKIIEVIPNGYSYTHQKVAHPQNVNKKNINLGYVGWLDSVRLDWDLLVSVANLHPNWNLFLAGYKYNYEKFLPRNIYVYRPIEKSAKNNLINKCDILLIPYKDIQLSNVSDPIKAYDYLSYRKPVVVTGVKRLKKYPYFYFSQNSLSEICRSIEKASKIKIQGSRIKNFLKGKTWSVRCSQMQKYLNFQ